MLAQPVRGLGGVRLSWVALCGGLLSCAVSKDATRNDAPPDTAERVPTVPFALGPTRPYASPQAAVSYVERAAELGLTGAHPDGDHGESGFVVVDDFDLDGDLDILVSHLRTGGGATVYRRSEAGFVAEPEAGPPSLTWLPSLLDLDGDGDRDILFGGGSTLINDGDHFTAGTLPLADGSALPPRLVRELVVGDLNRDGHDDLYAVCTGRDDGAPEAADFLLWGQPDGRFVVDLDTVPAAMGAHLGFDGLLIDLDNNGWLDVYVDNDKGGPNLVLFNDGGELRSGAEACDCAISHSGMGMDVADRNGDGLPDLYLSGTERNVLIESTAGGGYIDTTLIMDASPLENQGTVLAMSWGAVWLDHDNDGQQDLLITQGDLWDRAVGDPEDHMGDMPLSLLRGHETGGFTDESAALGLDAAGSFRAVVAADLNEDGVLDLIVTDVAAAPQLYWSEGCTAAGWLEVEAPRGARVEVTAGGHTQTDWVMTDSGWGAAQPPVVHFGLGDAQDVDHLRVVMPDGRVLDAETPFPARRRVAPPK